MTSPYREAAQLLLCPRCGEMLDRVFPGAAACPRCAGAWIEKPTIDRAFGDPRWPLGQNLWWHDELDCPECMLSGIVTRMSTRGSGDVRVDVCPSHGLWLDRGELNRLLGLDEGSDELLELQRRVTDGAPDSGEIAARRLAWQTEREARKRAAAARRAELQALQRQREADEAEEKKKRAAHSARSADDIEHDRQAAAAAQEVERQRLVEAEREAARARAAAEMHEANERAREKVAADEQMRDREAEQLAADYLERNTARRRAEELRLQLVAGRADVRVLQREVAERHGALAAATERVAKHTDELAGLEARLAALDARLG